MFTVAEETHFDSSCVMLSPESMEDLEVFRGDTVLLSSLAPEPKTALCIALSEEGLRDSIKTSVDALRNLGVQAGDSISVARPDFEVCYSTDIHVLPFQDTIGENDNTTVTQAAMTFFHEAYRPVTKGNCFVVHSGIEFKIVSLQPEAFGIVGPQTKISTTGDPLLRDSFAKSARK
mmetsp:Transcript_18939/g.23970  ORF Transcript_18939/g.23970 Transcript_18939/m.23970 type:complete len:176 (+) Transcript_18939:1933-2460(+)